jgi:hypothetical protein
MSEPTGEEIAAKLMTADPELVDRVARNIFKAHIMVQPYLVEKFYFETEETFVKTFSKAIEVLWGGTEEVDEGERYLYRTLALAALQAAGFEVEIPNPAIKAVLV